jgi:D-sedoheptulose 7-phosphate isomerase
MRALSELALRSVELAPKIEEAATLIVESIRAGGKVLVCGNGGSAAEAQHFAAELVGRYKRERRPLPAIALTTDTSVLTAIGNDYSFEEVFVRQIQAIGSEGDVLVLLSTSGISQNIRRTLYPAIDQGVEPLIVITGEKGSKNWTSAIAIPSSDTALVQEMTLSVLHSIAELVEEALCE